MNEIEKLYPSIILVEFDFPEGQEINSTFGDT
jgi:hypothetical protein